MKEVRFVSLQGLDKYDIYMQDFMYGDTRLFAFLIDVIYPTMNIMQLSTGFIKAFVSMIQA